MKKGKLSKIFDTKLARILLVLFGIGLIFLFWWIASLIIENFILDEGVLNVFFPGPQVVMPLFFNMLGQSKTFLNIGYTLLRMLISFVICFLLAFIFGTLAGLCKPVEKILKPLILVMRTIPTAALILSLIMFMRYQYALFIIILLVMFPILYEAFVSGINNIDPYIIEALKLDTHIASPRSIFRVLIPSASPYILLGVVQTLGLGLKVAIMAEVLLNSTEAYGIGVAFYIAKIDLAYDEMFAYSIYAILIIGLLDLLLSYFKKKLKAKIN